MEPDKAGRCQASRCGNGFLFLYRTLRMYRPTSGSIANVYSRAGDRCGGRAGARRRPRGHGVTVALVAHRMEAHIHHA
eukprot:scaffold37428_cov51-Phaeocystis_antarctica.AAC.1